MGYKKEWIQGTLEIKGNMYDGPATLQAIIHFAEEYPDFHFSYECNYQYGDAYLTSLYVYGQREATKEEAKEIRAKRRAEEKAADEWRLKREAELEAKEREEYEKLKRKFEPESN